MNHKSIRQTFFLCLALATLAALTGCSSSLTATPNPVGVGQPVSLSISVNGVGNGHAKHKQAKLTQDPEGAIPDLPKQVQLEYVGPSYYGGGGSYSGTVSVTAPAAPGSVTITATTKDTRNDPYLSASTVLTVE